MMATGCWGDGWNGGDWVDGYSRGWAVVVVVVAVVVVMTWLQNRFVFFSDQDNHVVVDVTRPRESEKWCRIA